MSPFDRIAQLTSQLADAREQAARVGRYAPKPLPALALFTLFVVLCYSLAP